MPCIFFFSYCGLGLWISMSIIYLFLKNKYITCANSALKTKLLASDFQGKEQRKMQCQWAGATESVPVSQLLLDDRASEPVKMKNRNLRNCQGNGKLICDSRYYAACPWSWWRHKIKLSTICAKWKHFEMKHRYWLPVFFHHCQKPLLTIHFISLAYTSGVSMHAETCDNFCLT